MTEPNSDGAPAGQETRIVLPEHIVTKETDRRGRITLGTDYGDRRITVAVIDSEPVED